MTTDESIALAKRQILTDIRDGRVPETVATFGALHDYVDANEYGALCTTVYEELRGDEEGDIPDALSTFADTVQNAIDTWLRAGRVEPDLRPVAEITTESGRIHIGVVWTGLILDRPTTGGWVLGARDMKLAQRLKRAIDAGAALVDPTVMVDVNGKTFAHATSKVLGRMMNADLVRLGF